MKKSGFTFIEILVVVTIIGMLTLMGVANFRVANQKARDGRRKGDLEQIRAALEIYRSDENVYPLTAAGLAVLNPTYMGEINDPSNNQVYYYESNGLTYTVCAALELGGTDICSGSCGTNITCNYKTTNPL